MNAHVTPNPIRTTADILTGDMVMRDVLFHHLLSEGYYAARRGFVALTLVVTDDDLEGYIASVGRFIDRYGYLMKG